MAQERTEFLTTIPTEKGKVLRWHGGDTGTAKGHERYGRDRDSSSSRDSRSPKERYPGPFFVRPN